MPVLTDAVEVYVGDPTHFATDIFVGTQRVWPPFPKFTYRKSADPQAINSGELNVRTRNGPEIIFGQQFRTDLTTPVAPHLVAFDGQQVAIVDRMTGTAMLAMVTQTTTTGVTFPGITVDQAVYDWIENLAAGDYLTLSLVPDAPFLVDYTFEFSAGFGSAWWASFQGGNTGVSQWTPSPNVVPPSPGATIAFLPPPGSSGTVRFATWTPGATGVTRDAIVVDWTNYAPSQPDYDIPDMDLVPLPPPPSPLPIDFDVAFITPGAAPVFIAVGGSSAIAGLQPGDQAYLTPFPLAHLLYTLVDHTPVQPGEMRYNSQGDGFQFHTTDATGFDATEVLGAVIVGDTLGLTDSPPPPPPHTITPADPTVSIPRSPGTFLPFGCDVPADIVEINAIHAARSLGGWTTPWGGGTWMVLRDGYLCRYYGPSMGFIRWIGTPPIYSPGAARNNVGSWKLTLNSYTTAGQVTVTPGANSVAALSNSVVGSIDLNAIDTTGTDRTADIMAQQVGDVVRLGDGRGDVAITLTQVPSGSGGVLSLVGTIQVNGDVRNDGQAFTLDAPRTAPTGPTGPTGIDLGRYSMGTQQSDLNTFSWDIAFGNQIDVPYVGLDGQDNTPYLSAITAGDVLHVVGPAGTIDFPIASFAVRGGGSPYGVRLSGVFPKSSVLTGTAPAQFDTLQVFLDLQNPPPPPPPPPPPVPDDTWTVEDIVLWLRDHGVDIDLDHANPPHLTKDELLDLVTDILDVP